MLLPVFTEFGQYLFFVIFIVAILGSAWKGGEVERAAAALFLYGLWVQLTAHLITKPKFLEVDEISLLVDTIYVGSLVWIALFANRVWPFWAAAFQMWSFVFHLPRGLLPYLGETTYAYLKSGPTGLALVALCFGLMAHIARQSRNGRYRQWRGPVISAGQNNGMSEIYESDLEVALARGWLEYPMFACGGLVALYALSAFFNPTDGPDATRGALTLLAIGLGTIAGGELWRRRENRLAWERKEAFTARWRAVRLGEVHARQVGSPTLN